MKPFDLTLKNYRSFAETQPAVLRITPGVTGLVGPNNGGKSSLLRLFYELRPLWKEIQDANGLTRPRIARDLVGVADPDEIFSNFSHAPINISIALAEVSARTCNRITLELRPDESAWHNSIWDESQPLKRAQVEGSRVVAEGEPVDVTGMLSVTSCLANMMYIGPFRNAVNAGESVYYDLNIGTKFVANWADLKTGDNKKKNRAAQDATEDIQRIFSFRSLEINPSNDRSTLQVIIDGKYYRLAELGAGLSQFIVSFASVATKRPSMLLIDEPELNLHPTLQEDFLLSLAKYTQHGVIFASHSLGLARAVSDRLYSVQKIADRSVVAPFEATPNFAEFAGSLGFSAYKQLGFDRILLVEGVTEVRTVQQWLRLYGKEHQVLVLPLGGSQMITANRDLELAELQRLDANVAVLVDSERKKEGEPLSESRLAFERTCRALDFNVVFTQLRATENYLTDSAIKAEKSDKYSALGPYEPLGEKSGGPKWGKHENWRIASRMTRAELDVTDLGKFFESL